MGVLWRTVKKKRAVNLKDNMGGRLSKGTPHRSVGPSINVRPELNPVEGSVGY